MKISATHSVVMSVFPLPLIYSIFVLFLSSMMLTNCTNHEDQFYISELRNKDQENQLPIDQSNLQTIRVSSDAIQEGNLSDLLKITDVIYLENTAPIGQIHKLLLYNDLLCIFDKDITNTVQLYDRTGRYLRTIGQKGEGPGEYKQIHDVQVNPYTNLLDIWDGMSQKMLSFDESGHLLHERPIDIFSAVFGVLDTSTYLFYKGNSIMEPGLDYKLIAIDAADQTVKGKFFQIREGEDQFKVQDPAIMLNYNAANGKHYFYRLFDDHIYSFKGQKMNVDYAIDFQNQSPRYEQINFNQDNQKVISEWLFNPAYFSMVGRAMETDRRLFFTFGKGNGIVYAFHNKQTHNTRFYLRLRNDITGTTVPQPLNADKRGNLYFADEPGMYVESIRSAARYKNVPENEILEQWKREKPLGYEIYNQVSEFDNPIILIGKYTFE